MPTIIQLAQAIERCMLEETVVNYVISADASELATVLGKMVYYKIDFIDLTQYSKKQCAAYARWKS